MKKFVIFFGFIMVSFFNSQNTRYPELKYETKFLNAENQYIALPYDNISKDSIKFGVPYYDAVAGFTFEYYGSFIKQNGKFVLPKNYQRPMVKIRWSTLNLEVALLPDHVIKDLGLPKEPDFLKNYKTGQNTKEDLVNKLSIINGTGNSDLALPHLEKLHQENYQSAKFYFELAYAYNALNKFPDAENVILEANKNGFKDNLLIKEMHYALLHLNRIEEADHYLYNNLDALGKYKSEEILNQILFYYNHSEYMKAQHWIEIYKTKIGTDQYKKEIDKFETLIKNKINLT